MSCVLGTLILFAGYFTPANTLPANGQLLSIAQYPELYSVIGKKYGPSGKYEFRAPNLNMSPNFWHNVNPFNPRWIVCVKGDKPTN